MNTPVLQHFLQIILSFLMALLPLYTLQAQHESKQSTPEKAVRVKIIEHINGEVVYSKDTILYSDDHKNRAYTFKTIKGDTLTWRANGRANIVLQPGKANGPVQPAKAFVYSVAGQQDIARVKRLKEVIVYSYGPGKSFKSERNTQLIKSIKDTVLVKSPRGNKVYFSSGDSIQSLRIERFKLVDSLGRENITIIEADSGQTIGFKSMRKPTIIIRKNPKAVIDTVQTSGKLKIETDAMGNTTIYELDASGNKTQLHSKSGHRAMVFVVKSVQIEAISAEDKVALQKNGTNVETKPKDELELEQIEYYPNPNDGKFDLRFTPASKGTTIVRVMDSKGHEVFSETVEKLNGEYRRQIDVTPFGKGLYFLQIAQGKRYHTKKILVR